jgi:hypothetical protein
VTLTVEVVGAEVLERLVEGLFDAAVVGGPDLAGEEYLGAGDTGFLDALADLGFVAVGLGRW